MSTLLPAIIFLVASQTGQQLPEKKSKLEMFTARQGTVFITGTTDVGSLKNSSGAVYLEAMEIIDSASGARATGIQITVNTGRSHTSFIDSDEVDSLLKGIAYLEKIDPSQLSITDGQFHAIYSTVSGGLKLSVLGNTRGKAEDMTFAVTSGNQVTAAFSPAKQFLQKFSALISAAPAKFSTKR